MASCLLESTALNPKTQVQKANLGTLRMETAAPNDYTMLLVRQLLALYRRMLQVGCAAVNHYDGLRRRVVFRLDARSGNIVG
jgi:hypothetical protein